MRGSQQPTGVLVKDPVLDGALVSDGAEQAAAGEGIIAAEAAQDGRLGTTSVGRRGTDHRESADDYHGELFRFGTYRVAAAAMASSGSTSASAPEFRPWGRLGTPSATATPARR